MSEFVYHTNKKKNPYFVAFAAVKGLKDGDTWKAHEYMAWISGRHAEFGKLHGFREHIVNYGNLQKEFEEEFLYKEVNHDG